MSARLIARNRVFLTSLTCARVKSTLRISFVHTTGLCSALLIWSSLYVVFVCFRSCIAGAQCCRLFDRCFFFLFLFSFVLRCWDLFEGWADGWMAGFERLSLLGWPQSLFGSRKEKNVGDEKAGLWFGGRCMGWISVWALMLMYVFTSYGK
ncbi:hypothetical protein VTK26DRAFT_5331 [Humicola hyalothermophila]